MVAYYAELLNSNVDGLKEKGFIFPYLNISNRKVFAKSLGCALEPKFGKIPKAELLAAVDNGYRVYDEYMESVRAEGEKAIAYARENGHRIMILAGRPYHIDREIGHGIEKLAASLGFVVVSEDSVYHLADTPEVRVLNQWTYHSRLYRAAVAATRNDDMELVQLVSFGCGVDAITTDEVRRILENGNKYYTQIKIDEITNLGAVKIRLRSLIGALEMR